MRIWRRAEHCRQERVCALLGFACGPQVHLGYLGCAFGCCWGFLLRHIREGIPVTAASQVEHGSTVNLAFPKPTVGSAQEAKFGRLVSLWEMLVLNSEKFLHLQEALSELSGLVVGAMAHKEIDELVMPVDEFMRSQAAEILDLTQSLSMLYSSKEAGRYRDFLDAEKVDGNVLRNNVNILATRIRDEISLRHMFVLTESETALYSDRDPFGVDVRAVLPDAAEDIEEAAKCLALGRSTGCVMHLARAMEMTLHALAAKSGAPFKVSADWKAVLDAVDNEINKWGYQSAAEVAKKDGYRQIHAHLSSVKNAWRHPSMHSRFSASPEVATDIYQAVKGFMRHAAEVMK
jgi:hypothetical protein